MSTAQLHPAGLSSYRVEVIDEHAMASRMRLSLAHLLEHNLDDGTEYRNRAWRTVEPIFRVVATHAATEDPAGQISGLSLRTVPEWNLFGLGDLAVWESHRRRGLGRLLCRRATEECWARGAKAILAKTKPMRSVLAELGYRPVTDFSYFYEDGDLAVRHLDWMAVAHVDPPAPVQLHQGDF
jgi:GNAT superfamily N-acetyltransferase